MAFLSKYTVCKRYFDDIWGDIFFRKKTAKFVKVMLKMRKRPLSYKIRKNRFLNFDVWYKKRYKWPKSYYGRLVIHKQKIKKFYSTMNDYQFREIVYRAQYHVVNWIRYFYYHLERRVDALLYRAHFAKTMGKIRQLINHRKVLLNNLIIDRPSITLKIGEFLTLKNTKNIKSIIFYKLKEKLLYAVYPSYLEVNYKSMKIFLCDYPTENSVFFPFKFDATKFANFFKSF